MRKLLLATLLLAALLNVTVPASGQANGRYFYETGHYIKGRFLDYWQAHGGLAQQGYPLSEEFSEQSQTDGKIYTVQYFERAEFEYHPESPSTPILLSLLGSVQYRNKYPTAAPRQVPNTTPGVVSFPQTGKRLGGSFLDYWKKNGGLAQQGYPISDEFLEVSALDGKSYKVQYFERTVFEAHPEKARPYDVLLSQVGRFQFQARHAGDTSLPTTSAPVFTSGALGLSKTENDEKYGASKRSGAGWDYDRLYIQYSEEGIALGINFDNPIAVPIKELRNLASYYIPTDSKLVHAGGIGAAESGDYLFDTYQSESLAHRYPSDTVNQWGHKDFWEGAAPGTFTVEYLPPADGEKPTERSTASILIIYVGSHHGGEYIK